MNKSLIITLSAVSLLYFGCSKSNNSDNGPKNTNSSPVTIQVVSGSGQTDTVGLQLANSIVVKVTQNGSPVSGYAVEFQGSGCNQDITFTTTTQSDGTASYIWRLAGDVGQQTLKAYALNASNQKVDSASATGTGIAAASGWQYSACSLVGGDPIIAFCKLSTGKLFACYPGKTYIRYSNDNGASWFALTTAGNTHSWAWILSTPTDELFAFAGGEATFYSKDAGQTWTQLSMQPFSLESINTGICTPDGRLIVTTKGDVSVSVDKGQTWVRTPASGFNPPSSTGGDEDFDSPTEDQNGSLYVVGRESETIYKSTDNGVTWTAQPKGATEQDFGFYVNSNNWYYKVIGGSSDAGLYLSKDNGNTYTELLGASFDFLDQFSIQSDGNYYCENIATGLYQSNALSGSAKLIYNWSLSEPVPYIVAKNNNIVLFNNNVSQIFYFQK